MTCQVMFGNGVTDIRMLMTGAIKIPIITIVAVHMTKAALKLASQVHIIVMVDLYGESVDSALPAHFLIREK